MFCPEVSTWQHPSLIFWFFHFVCLPLQDVLWTLWGLIISVPFRVEPSLNSHSFFSLGQDLSLYTDCYLVQKLLWPELEAVIYEYKHKYLEDSLITCLFSKTTIGLLSSVCCLFCLFQRELSPGLQYQNSLLWSRPQIQLESNWLPP